MGKIEISELITNSTSKEDYYSSNDELLIAKGTVINNTHIELLLKHNHKNLYIKKPQSDEDELQSLLSAEFDTFDDISLSESNSIELDIPSEPPKALELPQFKAIKKGRDGLEQLNNSPQTQKLESKLSKEQTSDNPTGTALNEDITEMTPEDRTDAYKEKVNNSYTTSLLSVNKILNSIANGDTISGKQIRNIVESFVENFIYDKNILINLSSKQNFGPKYIYTHSLNVCLLSINIAAAFNYSREQVVDIGIGALLYDVGMMLIPKEIYAKNERFTVDDQFEIHKHPILGLHLLESVTQLPSSAPFVAYQSHERENGSGYPKNRKGRFIHKYSKIIQIADIFLALSSHKSYRDAMIPYKAMETIVKMTRYGLVSGEFTKSLLMYTSLFPIGSLVELSDKSICKVIKANGTSFAKPTVTALTNSSGILLNEKEFYQVDLSKQQDIQIIKALPNDHLGDLNLMAGF